MNGAVTNKARYFQLFFKWEIRRNFLTYVYFYYEHLVPSSILLITPTKLLSRKKTSIMYFSHEHNKGYYFLFNYELCSSLSLGFDWRTARGLLPSYGPTIPRASISSINLAALV